MTGKIIVIEGTDCSGKETQSKLLIEKLNNEGLETKYMSFPNYKSPTGRIIGYPYLGKENLVKELLFNKYKKVLDYLQKENPKRKVDAQYVTRVFKALSCVLAEGWFPETAPNVDPKVSSLYYAADRAYNVDAIYETIDKGINVILDRYIYSNMAHQGGKIEDYTKRLEMYDWLYKLEFEMLNLPEADAKLFLHMPNEYAAYLRNGRKEALDENERNVSHLISAEKAYLEVADIYDFETIECVKNYEAEISRENIKTPEEINKEVYDVVKKELTRH